LELQFAKIFPWVQIMMVRTNFEEVQIKRLLQALYYPKGSKAFIFATQYNY